MGFGHSTVESADDWVHHNDVYGPPVAGGSLLVGVPGVSVPDGYYPLPCSSIIPTRTRARRRRAKRGHARLWEQAKRVAKQARGEYDDDSGDCYDERIAFEDYHVME